MKIEIKNHITYILQAELHDEIHHIFEQIAPYGNMYDIFTPEHLDLAIQKEMIWVVDILITSFGIYSENAFDYAYEKIM